MTVVEFPAPRQQTLQAKYICSACGPDRSCNCNAPAIEKLAQKQEQDRQRAKDYRARKAEENQQSRHVTESSPGFEKLCAEAAEKSPEEAARLAAGLLLLSYPLHPPRKPEQPRTGHFSTLTTPALFVHGTRDPFGSIAEMEAALPMIPGFHALIAVDKEGHGLKPKVAASLPPALSAMMKLI